jgi:hypothetical protein
MAHDHPDRPGLPDALALELRALEGIGPLALAEALHTTRFVGWASRGLVYLARRSGLTLDQLSEGAEAHTGRYRWVDAGEGVRLGYRRTGRSPRAGGPGIPTGPVRSIGTENRRRESRSAFFAGDFWLR